MVFLVDLEGTTCVGKTWTFAEVSRLASGALAAPARQPGISDARETRSRLIRAALRRFGFGRCNREACLPRHMVCVPQDFSPTQHLLLRYSGRSPIHGGRESTSEVRDLRKGPREVPDPRDPHASGPADSSPKPCDPHAVTVVSNGIGGDFFLHHSCQVADSDLNLRS